MKRECQRRHYASHKEELQRKSREFYRQLRGNNRTFASSENSVVKGVKKFLQASGKAERSQMLIMLYQAKKLSDNQLADSRTHPAFVPNGTHFAVVEETDGYLLYIVIAHCFLDFLLFILAFIVIGEDASGQIVHLLVMLTKHSFYVLFLFHTLSIQKPSKTITFFKNYRKTFNDTLSSTKP